MLGHPPKAAARAERGQEIESQKREGTSSKPRTVLAPRAGLEPATIRLTAQCMSSDSGFFVLVARMRACCSLVFGKELFRDCSVLLDRN